MESAQHPGLRILGTDFDVGPCHEQFGLAYQALNALLQLGMPFPILEALVGQNAFDLKHSPLLVDRAATIYSGYANGGKHGGFSQISAHLDR